MMEGWKEVKLEEIADVVGGGTPSTKEDSYWNGDVNWVTPADLSGYMFKHISAGERKITKLGLSKSSAKLHPKGTVLMTSRAPVGYLAIAGDEVATNQGFQSLRCKTDKVDHNFLYYILHLYKEGILAIASGATFPEVSGKKVKGFKIKIPPLHTQRKIASILSAYDELIENNLKRIKIMEEKAQLTYEEWFVRMRFPGHETMPINKETGLPEGWELVKVGALLAKLKSTKKIKSSEILESGSTPVIDQSRDFIKGYTNEPDALIDIDEPIIVFGDHTRILKFIDFNFSRGADGTQLVLSKDSRMPQHLFYQVLKGIDLSDYHYARHFKYLKDTEINICDEITANHYEDFAAPLFKAIKQMRDQNKLLKEARDILLPRLMTGIIDVEQMNIETLQTI